MKNANASEGKVYSIPLEGVESEHCALIVDKALDKVTGLASHNVEVNNKRAVVATQDANETIPAAVQAIRDVGYNVTVLKKNLQVTGMSCASCAVSTESVLRNLPGVLSVSVNYANAIAKIEYIPSITNTSDMKAALQMVGYDIAADDTADTRAELEDQQKRNYVALKKRAIGAVLLSAPLVVIGMVFMDMPYANLLMWLLATPVVVWFGRQFFINAWKQARHSSANMDTLVAMSTGVAYLFSVFNTLNPAYWTSRGLQPHVYFEAAAVVIAFILLGKLLEENAKGNTSSAIKKLMGMQPKTVMMVHDGGEIMEMPVGAVKPGNLLLVRPGERIPVDGTVSAGSSYVNESMISGEPVPVSKEEGDKVFAGTINEKGSFRFTADKVGGETVLAQIIATVQDAQGSKAPVQKQVDKIAAIFVPVVITIAIITLIVWILLGGENGFTRGMLSMVTVLVIACPCALGLATPTAIMVGIGKGAENGILIKDAESLELAKKVDAIVLDKTGTITEGKPVVTDILWLNGDDHLAWVLAALELQSEHPLAEAVVNYLGKQQGVTVSNFEGIRGLGAKGTVDGNSYYAGNRRLMDQHQITVDRSMADKGDQWTAEARTVIYFGNEQAVLAVVAIADKVKENSAKAIGMLHDAGIKVYMLTGDNEATAKAISSAVGITHYKAGVLPADKAAFIKELQQKGNTVAMVGDGINDSNALAQADVSIAMGKGSDIAIDVAKMTIISSDLMRIPEAIKLSKYTVATIRQNLFWAFIYNIIGIPLAAGVLYPVNGFLISPMVAGAAMALSSVSVVSNSLRLKWKRLV